MFSFSRFITAGVFVGLVFFTSIAQGAKPFNERSIAGIWALSVDGFVSGQGVLPGAGTPIFAIATVTFDGQGGCESVDQLVVGGARIPADPSGVRVASACTYEVSTDGLGFFDVTFPALPAFNLPETTTTASFVIRDRKTMHFIAENAELGIYGGGVLERQKGGSGQ